MSKDKIIRRTEDIADAVNGMNEAMLKTPQAIVDTQLKISEFNKKFPDAKYVEPKTRIPTAGVKHPEWEKQREYLHEYVVGVFESTMIQGKIEFWLTGLPSDDYCLWSIPCNKPVGVPRFVGQHLSKGLSWKEMKPLGRDNEPTAFYEEEMITPFTKFETKRRGTFHPINAY